MLNIVSKYFTQPGQISSPIFISSAPGIFNIYQSSLGFDRKHIWNSKNGIPLRMAICDQISKHQSWFAALKGHMLHLSAAPGVTGSDRLTYGRSGRVSSRISKMPLPVNYSTRGYTNSLLPLSETLIASCPQLFLGITFGKYLSSR